MRRADRLFDIIQTLRTAKGPVTAEGLAKRLEVTVRTVYRDVATLQARRVPIEGGPAEQITHGGGRRALESADGKTLYYGYAANSRLSAKGHSSSNHCAVTWKPAARARS